MNVIGFDPDITVDAAWRLSSSVRKAHTIDELLRQADFVTLHVPLLDVTRKMINAARIKLMKKSAILLNFSRDGIVDNDAVLEALPPAQRLRLPMRPHNRSLNLSNAVAVVVYEAWRQCGFEGSA